MFLLLVLDDANFNKNQEEYDISVPIMSIHPTSSSSASRIGVYDGNNDIGNKIVTRENIDDILNSLNHDELFDQDDFTTQLESLISKCIIFQNQASNAAASINATTMK